MTSNIKYQSDLKMDNDNTRHLDVFVQEHVEFQNLGFTQQTGKF